MIPWHNPAARRFTGFGKMDAPRFSILQCGIPEVQVQNLALSRQQFIINIQASHRPQMKSYDGVRDHAAHLGDFAFTRLDRAERFPSQLARSHPVFCKKLRGLCIQFPAQIIKFRLSRDSFTFASGIFSIW